MSIKSIYILANAAHGEGISGGDRIFIELAKRFKRKVHVVIFLWEEGKRMVVRQGLTEDKRLTFKILNVSWCQYGFLLCYLGRIIESLKSAVTLKIDEPQFCVIYSASEFWMDTMPAVVIKIRYPRIRWVATWFQTAPNPIKGFSEGHREQTYRLSALLYWLSQLPIKPLIKRYADFVLVNNEDERKQFSKLNREGRVGVVIGAVNVDQIDDYLSKHKQSTKAFDAVFQGRFHPQKGVVELIDIWGKVVDKIPNARLVMIGDGPLMEAVKARIREKGLEKNIILLGYIFDGDEKYNTFQSSKLVVHPAFYDSGGMAASEAMAFGLPCIGFNLKSYESYYPKGMVKVPIGDVGAFAKEIINLLKDEKERESLGREASKMIHSYWSWDQRSEEVSHLIFKEN